MKEKLKTIWLSIHRGECILFDYKLKSGKTLVDRATKPIDVDRRMTMFSLDDWNGIAGIENAYKIRFMERIRRQDISDGYISDQYDKERSELKRREIPVTYR